MRKDPFISFIMLEISLVSIYRTHHFVFEIMLISNHHRTTWNYSRVWHDCLFNDTVGNPDYTTSNDTAINEFEIVFNEHSLSWSSLFVSYWFCYYCANGVYFESAVTRYHMYAWYFVLLHQSGLSEIIRFCFFVTCYGFIMEMCRKFKR